MNPFQNESNTNYADLDKMWFKLREIEFISAKGSWQQAEYFTSTYQLLIITQGEASIKVDGITKIIQQNSIFICHSGQYLGITGVNEEAFSLFILRFDVKLDFTLEGNQMIFPLIGEVNISPITPLFDLCLALHSQWSNSTGLERFGNQLIFQQMLQHYYH